MDLDLDLDDFLLFPFPRCFPDGSTAPITVAAQCSRCFRGTAAILMQCSPDLSTVVRVQWITSAQMPAILPTSLTCAHNNNHGPARGAGRHAAAAAINRPAATAKGSPPRPGAVPGPLPPDCCLDDSGRNPLAGPSDLPLLGRHILITGAWVVRSSQVRA